jgi:hypothetical protein
VRTLVRKGQGLGQGSKAGKQSPKGGSEESAPRSALSKWLPFGAEPKAKHREDRKRYYDARKPARQQKRFGQGGDGE